MEQILSRLSGIDFVLAAPSAGAAERAGLRACTAPGAADRYTQLIASLKALRERIWPCLRTVQNGPGIDSAAWQILAVRSGSNTVLGAMRAFVWDEGQMTGDQLLEIQHCKFSAESQDQRPAIVAAINRHLTCTPSCRMLPGGFAIEPSPGINHLAVALGLSLSALAGLLGINDGIALATQRNFAGEFYRKLGGVFLKSNDRSDAPLAYVDALCGDTYNVIALDKDKVPPKARPAVMRLSGMFREAPVYA